MAEFGQPGERDTFIPPIHRKHWRDDRDDTGSRVSFFMIASVPLGYINYNGRIQVNKSLLNVVLPRPCQNTTRKANASRDQNYSEAVIFPSFKLYSARHSLVEVVQAQTCSCTGDLRRAN